MKTIKLIFGILCIVLAVVLIFQSCAATVGAAIIEGDTDSGSGGSIAGFLMIAVGIIMLATRKGGKGGSIACLIISLIAAILSFVFADQFPDLKIWGIWSLIIAVINLIAIIIPNKKKRKRRNTRRIMCIQNKTIPYVL